MSVRELLILFAIGLTVLFFFAKAQGPRSGEGSGMSRFWKIMLLIGVVFAINLVIRAPHPTRHHRTLLPPKPVPTPPAVRVEPRAWDEDDVAVKVVTPATTTRTRVRATKTIPAAPAPPPVPTWQVIGEARESYQEAWQSALEKASEVLTSELRLHAPLDPEFIGKKMVRGSSEKTIPLGGADRPNLGNATKIEMDLELKPEVRDELARAEREYRVEERMAWLGRLLAAGVVLLGAAGAYVRLDDWTKGYYTGWLRLCLGLGAAAAATAAWLSV